VLSLLLRFSLNHRWLVAGATTLVVGLGLWAFRTIPFEPFPDITANAVSVIAEVPGIAPQEVEQLVTFPIERALLGLPGATAVRSTTKFGLALTQVIFEDRVDGYFARQLVAQRLGDVAADLPAGVIPVLGPVSTAMGEVYQYVLTSRTREWGLGQLKALQDYTLAPMLRTVPGVAEVNSWGGETEQYHVVVDPHRLALAGLSLSQIEAALAANNANFGGAHTEDRGERFIVYGRGRLTGPDTTSPLPSQVIAPCRGSAPVVTCAMSRIRIGAPLRGACPG